MTGLTAVGRATVVGGRIMAVVRIVAVVRFMAVVRITGGGTGTTIGTTNTTATIRRHILDMFRIQLVARIIMVGVTTVIAGGTTTGIRIIATIMDRITASIVIVAVMRS